MWEQEIKEVETKTESRCNDERLLIYKENIIADALKDWSGKYETDKRKL